MVAIDMPKDLPQGATWTENRIWEKEVDEHVKRTAYLKDNISTLYSLVWGQCTNIVQQRVEAMDTFGQMSTTGDGLMLLRAIKDITYNFQSQKYLPHSLHKSKRRFYMLFQVRTTTTQAYLEQSQNMIDVIQHSGGIIGEDSGVEKMILGKKSKDNLSEAELIELKEVIKDQSMAVAFLLGANLLRYENLSKIWRMITYRGATITQPLCQPPII